MHGKVSFGRASVTQFVILLLNNIAQTLLVSLQSLALSAMQEYQLAHRAPCKVTLLAITEVVLVSGVHGDL